MHNLFIQKIDVKELKALIQEIISVELQKVIHAPANSPPLTEVSAKLLSQKEAAEILSISIPTLRKLVGEKRLKPVKVGNRNKFRKSEVINYKAN